MLCNSLLNGIDVLILILQVLRSRWYCHSLVWVIHC